MTGFLAAKKKRAASSRPSRALVGTTPTSAAAPSCGSWRTPTAWRPWSGSTGATEGPPPQWCWRGRTGCRSPARTSTSSAARIATPVGRGGKGTSFEEFVELQSFAVDCFVQELCVCVCVGVCLSLCVCVCVCACVCVSVNLPAFVWVIPNTFVS